MFRTGSIYPAKPMNRAVVKDDEWFECHLLVKGDKVVLKVNGEVTMDTTLPHEAKRGARLAAEPSRSRATIQAASCIFAAFA